MGCLRSLIISASIFVNFLAMGWLILVLITAKTLGNAALVAKNDAIAGLLLLLIAFAGNALLALLLLLGRRSRRKAGPAPGIEIMGKTQPPFPP
ncbi:MAG: hypothetical protein ACJ789_21480 [Thermomicrobiales bacterium]